MNFKKGDLVKIRTGKDKGKQGKITQVFPGLNKVVVESLNISKKHLRARRQSESGQVIEFSAPLLAGKVQLVCPKCSKVARIGYQLSADKPKVRICKKCKATI